MSEDEISKSKSPSVMTIVGDVSADRHAGLLIKKLKESRPDISFWGVGGDRMKEAGVELLHHLEEFTVFGISAVAKRIPLILKLEKELCAEIEARKPDLLLLVDYGGFNLRISSKVRDRFKDLPIVYFITPQVWASRPWRINKIKENISRALVIFPFEEAILREHGISSRFVGHPLSEQIPKEKDLPKKSDFLASIGMEKAEEIVSIFPGSRKQELLDHSPVLLQAMEELIEKRPGMKFIVSMASKNMEDLFKKALARCDLANHIDKEIFIISQDKNYAAMHHSDMVWAKSGTTTLEVAMFAKPMLIFYRGDWISYFIVLVVKTIKNVGLPNLLAGKKLVPELLQLDCSAKQFVRYTNDLLDVPGLQKEIVKELSSIKDRLGKGNYITNCAEEILKYLQPDPVDSA